MNRIPDQSERLPKMVGGSFWTAGKISFALGLISFLGVIGTLCDPGLTIDEPLDVRPGRSYVSTLRSQGLGFFRQPVVDLVFRDNAEHPPLGRWLLGIASTLGEPFEVLIRGRDPLGLYIASGRLAPALIFGALVGLVTFTASRRHDRGAGVVAGLSLLMMPRVFAHAHLAALDTFIAFFWCFALFTSVKAIRSKRVGPMMLIAGIAWGFALLTKIHAWFLPPIVLVYALVSLKPIRAIAVLSGWTLVGLVTFFLGWPWLWFDPLGRIRAYLGTGIDRVSIQTLYFGKVFLDREVPWHYPWVYFTSTIPVGLLLLGLWGTRLAWQDRHRDSSGLLYGGSILFFLVVFSTRVPVYDGERLFLLTFPLFAILIGRGFSALFRSAQGKIRIALMLFLATQSYGLIALHPFGLSYYSAIVGGLPGAERLGLELTYWGDSVDSSLLGRLADLTSEGETAALAPTLAPGQGKVATTRRLIAKKIVLGDQGDLSKSQWLVVYRREAYWTPELRTRLREGHMVFAQTRQGVWLSALIQRR
jgi:hypothetical protein